MSDEKQSAQPGWERMLAALLPLFGHRNWIVVADAAYPAQSKPGIETIVAGDDQLPVVRKVLDAIVAAGHVRANVYIDRELGFVNEDDAPGIDDYRKQLDAVLYGSRAHRLPHEQIIARLDKSAEVFRILIVKTEMTIPYTSVFFELDCGYWSAEAEDRLRLSMAASNSK
jgi:L-fucose mutarotase/ribose pyranase (RbsD/FucU family)